MSQNQSEIEAVFLRAAMLRPNVNMCEASRQLIESHLDEQLLPATLENITAAIDVLNCLDQLPLRSEAARAAPALKTPPVEQAPEPEGPAVDLRKLTVAQLREYIRRQKKQTMPPMYTADFIKNLSRQSYEKICIEFGSQAVRDRLKGR
jgi:hypothetical protein